jgi:hypothetical protein
MVATNQVKSTKDPGTYCYKISSKLSSTVVTLLLSVLREFENVSGLRG